MPIVFISHIAVEADGAYLRLLVPVAIEEVDPAPLRSGEHTPIGAAQECQELAVIGNPQHASAAGDEQQQSGDEEQP